MLRYLQRLLPSDRFLRTQNDQLQREFTKNLQFEYNENDSLFTVIGFWPDSGQRFIDHVAAETGDDAERKILIQHPGLMIVCSILGQQIAADTETYIQKAG